MTNPEQQGEYRPTHYNELMVGARLLARRPFDALLLGMAQGIHDGQGENNFMSYTARSQKEGREITIERKAFDKPNTQFVTHIQFGPDAGEDIADIWATCHRRQLGKPDTFLTNYFSINPDRNSLWRPHLLLDLRDVRHIQKRTAKRQTQFAQRQIS